MYNYDFYVVELFVWMVLCISQRTIAFTKIFSDFYTIIRKSLHPTRPLTEQHYKKEVQQKWHQFLPWCMVIYLSLVSFHRNRASVTEQKMAHTETFPWYSLFFCQTWRCSFVDILSRSTNKCIFTYKRVFQVWESWEVLANDCEKNMLFLPTNG